MNTLEYAKQILSRMCAGMELVDDAPVEAFVDAVLKAKRIYVAGAGRSMLMLRAFAMRLMHLGFVSYVVGETVTPAAGEGDLLVMGSGSGETSTMKAIAEKAKKAGMTIATITTFPESSLGKAAGVVVALQGKITQGDDNMQSGQPGGSVFEQNMLILLDSVVLRLADKANIDLRRFALHANLE